MKDFQQSASMSNQEDPESFQKEWKSSQIKARCSELLTHSSAAVASATRSAPAGTAPAHS